MKSEAYQLEANMELVTLLQVLAAAAPMGGGALTPSSAKALARATSSTANRSRLRPLPYVFPCRLSNKHCLIKRQDGST